MGKVAIQQALVLVLKLTYKHAARLSGVHERTCWQHVQAGKGSKVRPWQNRTRTQQDEAIKAALRLVADEFPKNP